MPKIQHYIVRTRITTEVCDGISERLIAKVTSTGEAEGDSNAHAKSTGVAFCAARALAEASDRHEAMTCAVADNESQRLRTAEEFATELLESMDDQQPAPRAGLS